MKTLFIIWLKAVWGVVIGFGIMYMLAGYVDTRPSEPDPEIRAGGVCFFLFGAALCAIAAIAAVLWEVL